MNRVGGKHPSSPPSDNDGEPVLKRARTDEAPPPQLPEELLLGIFALLSAKDLGRASCVCRQWRSVSEDELLWKVLLPQDFPMFFKSTKITGDRLAYLDCASIRANLMKGSFFFQSLDDTAARFGRMSYSEGRLVSMSYVAKESTMVPIPVEDSLFCLHPNISNLFEKKLWKHWDLKKCQSLHERDASSLNSSIFAFDAERLYSLDPQDAAAVDVADFETGKHIETYRGHPHPIDRLWLAKGQLIAASFSNGEETNSSLTIWDLETKCSYPFIFIDGVFCDMRVVDDTLLTAHLCDGGIAPYIIRICDLNSHACLRTFKNAIGAIEDFNASICFEKKFFCYNSVTNSISIWSISTGELIHTVEEIHFATGMSVGALCCVGDKLIVNLYDRIRIYNLKTKEWLYLLKEKRTKNNNYLLILHADEYVIVTCNKIKGIIEIWDIQSGALYSKIKIEGFISSAIYRDGKIFALNEIHNRVEIYDFNRQS